MWKCVVFLQMGVHRASYFPWHQMRVVFICLLFSSSKVLTFCHVFMRNREHGSYSWCACLTSPHKWLDHFQTRPAFLRSLISSDWISFYSLTNVSVCFIIVFVLVHSFLFSYRLALVRKQVFYKNYGGNDWFTNLPLNVRLGLCITFRLHHLVFEL